jgi:transcriptional regulator with XRE-family HTH domain
MSDAAQSETPDRARREHTPTTAVRRRKPGFVPYGQFDGPRLLLEWMRDLRITALDLAALITSSRASIMRWRAGSHRPGWAMRERIDVASRGRVPIESWFPPGQTGREPGSRIAPTKKGDKRAINNRASARARAEILREARRRLNLFYRWEERYYRGRGVGPEGASERAPWTERTRKTRTRSAPAGGGW